MSTTSDRYGEATQGAGRAVPGAGPGHNRVSQARDGRNRLSRLPLLASLALFAASWLMPVTAGNDTRVGMVDDSEVVAAAENAIYLPEPIPDPIEPVNRGLWALNKGFMVTVIQPTSKGYRWVVREPVRRGIRNFGRNLGYPRRLLNNLLQTKWAGARDETARFMCNTVLGLGGIFDVATRVDIPHWEADFGQTLGLWGWKPRMYLMLPIAGPSNERDALGGIADRLMNPISYFPPYSYIPYGITYNNLSDTVDEYVRASIIDFDPYYVLRYAWTVKRENRPVQLTFAGGQHVASLETLQSVFFTFQNPEFPESGEKGTVELPWTETRLPFNYWMQPTNAPLVYVVPGLGSHRLSGGALALAELLHREGYSVVCVSSTYNYEFMERGSSVAMPGYTPVDAGDLHRALTEIDRYLEKQYPERSTARAIMGYSMGGFHALYLAGTEDARDSSLLEFDRYVAIDPPIRLTYAISQLDEYFRAALEWPAAHRTEHIEETFLKVGALARKLDEMTPESVIPFSAAESKFLIGLAFRLNLRDIIFLSQLKTNQGVLNHPVSIWRREAVYREILQFSYEDYLERFVIPYYQARGMELRDEQTFARAVDLRSHTAALKENERVRLIENANDILLGEEDLEWLRETFDPERLTVFESGGHLGNLSHPAVQQVILDALAGLWKR